MTDLPSPPSRETTLAAFAAYLDWLATTPLLEPDLIRRPGPDGWKLTHNGPQLRRAGKTDAVVDFLRRLPYVAPDAAPLPLPIAGNSTHQITCYFTRGGLEELESVADEEIAAQFAYVVGDPPSQVLGPHDVCLTTGGREESYVILNVQTWLVREYVLYEPPRDGNGDVIDSEQAYQQLPGQDLRDLLARWRQNFEDLEWVIVPGHHYTTMIDGPDPEERVDEARDIYEQYGWPPGPDFRLEECKTALKRLVARWEGRDPDLES